MAPGVELPRFGDRRREEATGGHLLRRQEPTWHFE